MAVIDNKYKLIELKQRILYQQPSKEIYEKVRSTLKQLNELESTNDFRQHQLQIVEEDKELQLKMTDQMVETIFNVEQKFNECQEKLNSKMKMIAGENEVKQQQQQQQLSSYMINLIQQRFTIIDKKFECQSIFQQDYYFRNHFDEESQTVILKKICFSPTMMMATPLHLFTHEQLTLLNRGPSYSSPYQNYLSMINNNINLNEFMEKQFKILKHDLNIFYVKQQINVAKSMFISKEIKDIYSTLFSSALLSLPDTLYQRAVYEQKLVKSIQDHLKHYNLILRRTADQCNVFYLDTRADFEEKIHHYMTTTDMFELCEIINEEHRSNAIHQYLLRILEQFNENIQIHLDDRKKYRSILDKIMIDIEQIKMPYLYFLPDISQVILDGLF